MCRCRCAVTARGRGEGDASQVALAQKPTERISPHRVGGLPPRRFIASFTGYDSTHNYGYTGVWAWDLPNNRDHQTTSSLIGGQVQNQTWIDLYGPGAPWSYFWCQWENLCDVDMLVPPMRPFVVPSDSTFEGNVVFDGVPAQHWRYTFNGDKLHLVTDYMVAKIPASGGSGGDVWFPLNIEYSGTQPRVSVNWTSVELAELPASDYAIPASWNCQPFAEADGSLQETRLRVAEVMQRTQHRSWTDASAIPRTGMSTVGRALGSAALRAGLPRGDTCPPSS